MTCWVALEETLVQSVIMRLISHTLLMNLLLILWYPFMLIIFHRFVFTYRNSLGTPSKQGKSPASLRKSSPRASSVPPKPKGRCLSLMWVHIWFDCVFFIFNEQLHFYITLTFFKFSQLICSLTFHPLTTNLFNWNFHTLEVVSHYHDPQLQVGENYSYLFNLRSNIWNSLCLNAHLISNDRLIKQVLNDHSCA